MSDQHTNASRNVSSPVARCYQLPMRSWLLLPLVLVATGCVERAYAQSAPRFRVSAPSDGGDPALSRDATVPAILLGESPDAASTLGTRIGNVSGRGGLGPALTRVGNGVRHTPAVRIGLDASHHGMGGGASSAGNAGNAGSGGGIGARSTPTGAVALRVAVESRGNGLSLEVVRRALATRRAQFAYCFLRTLGAGSSTAVTVVARFRVTRGANGAANVEVSSVQGGPDAINECVRARIGAVVFPAPTTAAPVSVTYTLSA
jgi:hypothetical protein